ncbi:hypothetical protein TL08_05285 [Actinoalloteichus hymeniacidonis]|uniref:Uncharacterized protein n=1 Tax=Actinoalloteichus hymeniacidonis TaxID=340345 RepID=A0AAC9HMJ5_9PSEU|nr:hypothetical protein TL08_05285 [Actinoalloteichus hymeniacidonis]
MLFDVAHPCDAHPGDVRQFLLRQARTLAELSEEPAEIVDTRRGCRTDPPPVDPPACYCFPPEHVINLGPGARRLLALTRTVIAPIRFLGLGYGSPVGAAPECGGRRSRGVLPKRCRKVVLNALCEAKPAACAMFEMDRCR